MKFRILCWILLSRIEIHQTKKVDWWHIEIHQYFRFVEPWVLSNPKIYILWYILEPETQDPTQTSMVEYVFLGFLLGYDRIF